MAEKKVSVRLVAEGRRRVRAELEGVGEAPRRLMLASGLCWLRKRCHSRLVNCDPWSEWIITLALGLRRQTAASRACSAKSVVMRGWADQPTTRRENRSMTTARYSHPS